MLLTCRSGSKMVVFYPRKQTSVSYAADCDVMVCYGNAKRVEKHLSAHGALR
ncbi:hypothetical protein SAMN05443248_0547 [Bradyrhizobium erythrophlei]|jgi:hypothetical protein|uniref:Uncharacterized protein n=1 Tax=Bradyrhizobium erythrophlei TaxID=1437360 RepID=A0A1M5HMU0_9BRAD|nr:hypothetical protein SAMN05443248_0547 [Bradyrhizobium erythrophlei]